jgi:RNA polymerase sigma factor (sigma-70 family)
VFAEKDYTMYKAAMTYNPERKTKFSTWLGNYTKYSCLNILKKNSKYVSHEIKPEEGESPTSLLDKYVSENSGYEDPAEEIRERVFCILEKVKDKRIHEIFKLRYAPEERKKMTWKRIAKRLDISAQTAINLHSKGTKIVSQKINSDYPDIL